MKNLSPFRALYWKEASKSLKSIKALTVLALFIALYAVLYSDFFSIPITPLLKIKFSFLVVAIIAYLFGPYAALLSGFLADIVGFLIFPSEFGYFPGYILNKMAAGFIFALFLYRAKPSISRFGIAKLLVNVFLNVFLESVWKNIFVPKSYWYYVSTGFLKNIIALPFEIILFIIIIKLLNPIFKQAQLIPEEYYYHL